MSGPITPANTKPKAQAVTDTTGAVTDVTQGTQTSSATKPTINPDAEAAATAQLEEILKGLLNKQGYAKISAALAQGAEHLNIQKSIFNSATDMAGQIKIGGNMLKNMQSMAGSSKGMAQKYTTGNEESNVVTQLIQALTQHNKTQ